METAPLADKMHTAHDPSCDKDIIFMATSWISQEVGMSMHNEEEIQTPFNSAFENKTEQISRKHAQQQPLMYLKKWNNSDHNCQYGLNIFARQEKTSGNRGMYIKEQKYKAKLSYLPCCNRYHMWSEANSSCAC